jgi:hypothetical protein
MAAVPEPGTLTLLLITLGIGGFIAMLKSRKRTIMRLSVFLMALGLVGALVAPSEAGTMQYRTLINGAVVEDFIEPGVNGVMPNEWFDVQVQVNVPDSYLPIVDDQGGMMQVAFNLRDSTGIGPSPPFPSDPPYPDCDDTALAGEEKKVFGSGTGLWNSSAVSPLVHVQGELNTNPDVYQDVAYVPPAQQFDLYNAYGAGPDVWTTVVTGRFIWDGTHAWLAVEPYSPLSQLIFGVKDPDGDLFDPANYGAMYPTEVSGSAVEFLPEPGSLLLLLSGGVALLLYRRRRA